MGGRIRYRLESTSVKVGFRRNNARTAGVVKDYKVECCKAGGSSVTWVCGSAFVPAKDNLPLSPLALCKRVFNVARGIRT